MAPTIVTPSNKVHLSCSMELSKKKSSLIVFYKYTILQDCLHWKNRIKQSYLQKLKTEAIQHQTFIIAMIHYIKWTSLYGGFCVKWCFLYSVFCVIRHFLEKLHLEGKIIPKEERAGRERLSCPFPVLLGSLTKYFATKPVFLYNNNIAYMDCIVIVKQFVRKCIIYWGHLWDSV